ncbi:MAG: hypothetical protein Q4A03_02575 [Rothia sp. (in: high G+C Gram-positive bacteria)]|uniref:hypothetical protein n=1 Tax=Rothia sp. (in: high G+C Gram-positive bacteria) TaxID=1885016 RepID=UPI0027096533|nr:hypothetical protein [Rothia sp. (in: high G+C Gram-positive bacteria)]
MSGWIGTLANMHEFLWPVSLQESLPTRYELQKAAGKTWAFVSSPPSARNREWSVEIDGTNADTSVLRSIMHGAYGPGPFYFISEVASLTNALTPAQSLLAGVSNGGIMVDSTGSKAPASLIGGQLAVIADKVPVLPGEPLTVSVDAAGPTELIVQPRSVTGANAGGAITVSAKGELMQRIHAVIPSVPSTARYVTISARGYTQLARPQVVWADEPSVWDVGGGADSVILMEGSSSFTQFELYTRDFWRSMSLTIKEVG